MSTPRDFPASVCARFADALPLYTSGELVPTEHDALPAHLASCPACLAQLSGYAALDAAVRQSYGIPQAAAPFLSFDAIVSRTASADAPQDAPPATAPSCDAPDGTETATPIAALSAWTRTRRVPTIHEVDVMSDLNESLPPDSTATRAAPRAHRARNIAAVAAVVALVALATAIFQGFGGSHGVNTPHVGNNAPTSTNVTPAKHKISAWQSVATFKNSGGANYATFAVAESDPSIVFQAGPGMTLQRSSDGGAHWSALSAPAQDVASDPNPGVSILISPLDANTVFAMISGSPSDPKCPKAIPGLSIGAKIVLSGGYSCTFEYVSKDGGASWQALNLPSAGHVGTPDNLSGAFQVQGDWLISQLTTDMNGPAPLGYRLVKSSDGVNWQYADSTLAQHGLVVQQYVVSARGGELFALTAPSGDINGGGNQSSSFDLWHSSNAGGSWTDIGPFTQAPQTNGAQLSAVTINAANAVQVYSTAQAVSDGHQIIYASTDDGRTWGPAPTTGLPPELSHPPATPVNAAPELPGSRGPTVWPVGALADGSLVVEYSQEDTMSLPPLPDGGTQWFNQYSHITYYALTPGANAWTALTPALGDGYVQTQWLSLGSGGKASAIYTMQSAATLNNPNSTDVTLSRCTLG